MLRNNKKIINTNIYTAGSSIQPFLLNRDGSLYLDKCGLKSGGVANLIAPYQTQNAAEQNHLLFYVLKGELEVTGADYFFNLVPGTVFILPFGIIRHIIQKTSYCKIIYLHLFDLEMWKSIYSIGPAIKHSSQITELEFTCDWLIKAMHAHQNRSNNTIEYLCGLLAEIIKSEVNIFQQTIPHYLYQKFKTLWVDIEQNPARKWTIPEMAARMGVSEGHFHRLCQDFYHQPPLTKVTQLRMKEAQKLLIHSSLSLQEIAELLSYESAYSFSNAFLKTIGIRPGQYRKKYRNMSF